MKQPEYVPDSPVFRFLVPAEPRQFPGQRWAKIISRAIHVLTAGIYLGAVVFEVEPGAYRPWLLAALLSGLAMLCLDLFESGAFLLQLRGLNLLAKLVLLGFLPKFGAGKIWILLVIAIVSVVTSHASGNFRHFLIWGRGRIKGPESKG